LFSDKIDFVTVSFNYSSVFICLYLYDDDYDYGCDTFSHCDAVGTLFFLLFYYSSSAIRVLRSILTCAGARLQPFNDIWQPSVH